MGLEVELKYRVEDSAAITKAAEGLGAQWVGDENHEDRYYSAPHRDFAQTDEALRLRRTSALAWVTYKGPKIDPQSKSRREIEAPIDLKTADTFGELLEALSFSPVFTIRKRRRIYFLTWKEWPTMIALDEVEKLPTYLELEIHASEDQLDVARDALLELADRLGVREVERRSYLEMLMNPAE